MATDTLYSLRYGGHLEEVAVEWETIFDEAAEIMRRADEFIPQPGQKPVEIPNLPDEVKEFLRVQPEFTDPKELAKVQPKFKMGEVSIRAFDMVGRALAVFAAIQLAVQVYDIIQQENYSPPRRRRKRKTQICVRKCLQIVSSIKSDFQEGYFENRALQSDSGLVRKRRKFKSRA